jgi:UDP-glucuronate 4-epimerase
MVVLVTGAAGFIGSHLCERLLARGDHVVGLDNFDAFYPRPVKERNLELARSHAAFRFLEGDIRDSAAVAQALAAAAGPIDTVVHLAALAGVRPSLLEPERFYDVNLVGTLRLLEACARAGQRRIVFASSSSVYGLDSQVPFREEDPCARPLSPYAASKRAGELLAFNHHHLHGAAITCLRFFTVYGARQRPDLAIHKFTRAIARGEPIELYGDGNSARDYTFIDDIVDGVVAAIDRQAAAAAPSYRVYNLGGSRTTSLARLVELIAAAVGQTPQIVRKPEQPGDMKQTLAELSLSARELGYAPKITIEAGIPRFVEWWRHQQPRAGYG